MSTEKNIPFRSENHRVVGGNRQSRTTNKIPPESAGEEDGILTNADGAIMETGPRIYIPAKTHLHFGRCLATIQVATPSKAKPANGRTFGTNQLAF
jgi:hypothetical protein